MPEGRAFESRARSLVQLCVKRGADAFLVKPLGSEEVRHIWQFIKDLPEGSFKRAVQQSRASFVKKHGPSSVGDDVATDHNSHSVLARAGALGAGMPMDSIMVCAGMGGGTSAQAKGSNSMSTPGSAHDNEHDLSGIVRVRMPSLHDGSNGGGVPRRFTTESGHSGMSSTCSTGLDDVEVPVGADCKQQ